MSAAIEPGMWVECIRSGTQPETAHVRVGAILCVEDVDPPRPGAECNHCDGTCVGLRLVGVRAPFWLSGCCYRPIYRPRSDLIQSLLQPAPEAVRERIGEPA